EEIKSFRVGHDTSLSKRSPSPGRWIRSDRHPGSRRRTHCALTTHSVDWSAYPLQTPSGGGHAPTPYRSKTPAGGTTQKGIDSSRPVTEAPDEKAVRKRPA